MKCVCGYEYEEGYGDAETVGDEEFIRIDIKATRESSGWHGDLINVYIYACPKCGTLKCDLY